MTQIKHSDINSLLENISKELQNCLNDNLVGIYIFGSLAWGDFNYKSSDIDIVVVTNSDITSQNFVALDLIHKKLIETYPYWDDRIEIAYVSLSSLRNLKKSMCNIALISPGEPFNIKVAGTDWMINFYLLQNNNITVFGPEPKMILPLITKDEFMFNVKQQALEWKDWIVNTKDSIGYQYYAVLTLCRAYYVICNGEQVSKKTAGNYAKLKFDKWKSLIEEALSYYQSSSEKLDKNRYELVHQFTQEIVNIIEDLPIKDVEVVPYDPSWPNIFDIEAKKIKAALGNSFASIHHVGSTSVPGLAAKPKIDIIACVNHLDFDHQGLANLNYEYRGGFNLPLRKSFTYRSPDLNVNLHIFEENDPEVELNLLFRDYLRENVQARDQYAALKYKLLEDDASHKKDGAMYRGYTLGKHDLIQDILNKSGFKRLRFVICTHYTEWSAAKQFRNKYFFEPNKIEDPYTWTFDHKDHKHFILYQGVNIVGYAHVQLWPENRAALRIIVIDEKEQGKGYGKEFMSLIEKWLRLEGYKSIHTESSPEALKFYQAINYVKMSFDDPDGYEGSPDDIEMGKLL